MELVLDDVDVDDVEGLDEVVELFVDEVLVVVEGRVVEDVVEDVDDVVELDVVVVVATFVEKSSAAA